MSSGESVDPMIKAVLIFLGIGAAAFILFSAVAIIALAWCHHPEGIIKYYKNRRKKKK